MEKFCVIHRFDDCEGICECFAAESYNSALALLVKKFFDGDESCLDDFYVSADTWAENGHEWHIARLYEKGDINY